MQRGNQKGVGSGEWGVGERKIFLHHSPKFAAIIVAARARMGERKIFLPQSLFAFFALFAFFSPSFAQQSRQAEMIRLGQEFELKINQEATIEGEGLTVAFESVLEDGRCPEDVNCIWAGNAKIKIKLSKRARTPGAVELNTGVKPKSSSFLNYDIKLVALNPRPKADKPVEKNEYKATLIVVKK
jgi:hypothetical protein